MRMFSVFMGVLLTAISIAGQVPTQKPAASGTTPVQAGEEKKIPDPQADEKYIIGLEDVLSVNVWREPELSAAELVVRPDGKITLPLVGDIKADGLTTKQLQDQLTEKLKEFVAAPTVTVMVLKVMSRKVSVVGMVSKPGVYPLGGPMTVLELLARAGGLQEYAKEKEIKILRTRNGKTDQFRFNYKDVKNGKNLGQNIVLENGDVVIVP